MEEATHRRRLSMPAGLPTPLTRAYSAEHLSDEVPQYSPTYGYSEPITPPCSTSSHQSILFPNIKAQLANGGTMKAPIAQQFPEEVITPTSFSSSSSFEQSFPQQYGQNLGRTGAQYKSHNRSYSYTPNDAAVTMSRMSLDAGGLSSPFTNTMPSSLPTPRPRALSSGVFDFLDSYESWNRPLLQQHPAHAQPQPRPQLVTRSSQASLLSVSSAPASSIPGNTNQYLASPFSLNRSGSQTYVQPVVQPAALDSYGNGAYPQPMPLDNYGNGTYPQPVVASVERGIPVVTSIPAPLSDPTTPPSSDETPVPNAKPEPVVKEKPSTESKPKDAGDSSGSALHATHAPRPRGPSRQASSSSVNGSALSKAQDKKPFEQLSLADIYALCRDQRGCRLLQRRLQDNNPALVTKIFEATHKHMTTLMSDPFGNYFCQKLVEYCSDEQLTSILETIAPSMKAIALNQHGTRALQRTIEVLRLPSQVQLVVSALDGAVVELIRDLNGNHVVQKILLEFDESGSQFIYDAVGENIIEVGSHRHGCCVLQRCIDYASAANRHKLVSSIVLNTRTLVCDPFGNYVCQYVISLETPEYTNALGEQMLGSIATLSVQKFSSNVVEKCLRAASPSLAEKIVYEIIQSRTLHSLLLDSYGNYVIQTALDSCSGETRGVLAEAIQAALKSTRSPYGRRIMSKLKD